MVNSINSNIECLLWNAADRLRGRVTAERAADATLALFFLKYLSESGEVCLSEIALQQILKESIVALASKEKEAVADAIERIAITLFEIGKTESLLASLVDFGLQDLLKEIVREDPSPVAEVLTVLENISLNELSLDEISSAFQWIIDKKSESAADMATPATVRDLMTGLLPNRTEVSCYDPVCGYGSLIKQVLKTRSGKGYGQDLNLSTLILAAMNLYLSGSKFELGAGDTLMSPKWESEGRVKQFDAVLANPPFGVRLSPLDLVSKAKGRFRHELPISSETAFLQHVRASLKSDGHGVIIVPNGVLFRGGVDETIRKELVEYGELEAVVQLPSYLFAGTAIAASILVLNGSEISAPNSEVIFIDLTEHAEGATTKRRLTRSGIETAISIVRDRKIVQWMSALAEKKEIEKAGYNLVPSRYIDSVKSENATFAELYADFEDAARRRDETEVLANRLIRGLKDDGIVRNGKVCDD